MIERILTIARGSLGPTLNRSIDKKSLNPATATPSASSNYVFRRMAATIVPGADGIAPPYTSRSCHSQVSRSALKRDIGSDKIWLFGASFGGLSRNMRMMSCTKATSIPSSSASLNNGGMAHSK